MPALIHQVDLCVCYILTAELLANRRYAYPWWKEKVIDSYVKRKDGLCPLTPEEIALVLRALEVDRSMQIYVAAGEIYGGKRRMASLTSAYPNVVCTNWCNVFHSHHCLANCISLFSFWLMMNLYLCIGEKGDALGTV